MSTTITRAEIIALAVTPSEVVAVMECNAAVTIPAPPVGEFEKEKAEVPSPSIPVSEKAALPKIATGQTLTARSVCDWDCIFTVEILERKGQFVRLKDQGTERRVKVFADESGEFIYALGRYSMAPIFRATSDTKPAEKPAPPVIPVSKAEKSDADLVAELKQATSDAMACDPRVYQVDGEDPAFDAAIQRMESLSTELAKRREKPVRPRHSRRSPLHLHGPAKRRGAILAVYTRPKASVAPLPPYRGVENQFMENTHTTETARACQKSEEEFRFQHAEKLLAMSIENLYALRAELDRLVSQTPMSEDRYLALKRLAKRIGACALEGL